MQWIRTRCEHSALLHGPSPHDTEGRGGRGGIAHAQFYRSRNCANSLTKMSSIRDTQSWSVSQNPCIDCMYACIPTGTCDAMPSGAHARPRLLQPLRFLSGHGRYRLRAQEQGRMNKRLKTCAGACATRHSLAYTFLFQECRQVLNLRRRAPGFTWPADYYKWQCIAMAMELAARNRLGSNARPGG